METSKAVHAVLYPRSLATISISILFTAMYLLIYFLANSPWAGFVISVLFSLYAYAVWIYLLYSLVTQFRYKPPKHSFLPILTFVALYILTVVHNATLYSSVTRLAPDAFIGIQAETEPLWRILYLSFFLATETLSALGTGSIFANPTTKQSGVGFIPVFLESIQALLTFTWVGWGFAMLTFRSGMQQVGRRDDGVRQYLTELAKGTL